MASEADLISRMGHAKLASIGDLTDALDACIVGTVRASRVLFSPGRGAPCVAYHFRDSMGHDEHREVPFVLEDDSGQAWIEPSNAVLLVAVREGDGLHRSIVGAGYLRSHGRPGSHREQCVEVGQRLYVVGACTRRLDAKASGTQLYRDRPVSRLYFAQCDSAPLLLADQLPVGNASAPLRRVSWMVDLLCAPLAERRSMSPQRIKQRPDQ